MTADTTAATAAVDELIEAVGWLAASLLPGTRRPYRAPTMPDEKRDELARLDRQLRHNLGYGMQIPLGESPAPMDLAVEDLLTEVVESVDSMSRQVALAADVDPSWFVASSTGIVTYFVAAEHALTNPAPYLVRIKALLPRAADVARSIERRCDDHTFRIHEILGLFGDGQILRSACPWCGGKTEKSPAGGELTLRVRLVLPQGKRTFAGVDPREIRWLVVCTGGRCEPPSRDVGTWWRGMPAWDLANEGEWLANRLERATA